MEYNRRPYTQANYRLVERGGGGSPSLLTDTHTLLSFPRAHSPLTTLSSSSPLSSSLENVLSLVGKHSLERHTERPRRTTHNRTHTQIDTRRCRSALLNAVECGAVALRESRADLREVWSRMNFNFWNFQRFLGDFR